jgi:hypothetical protein
MNLLASREYPVIDYQTMAEFIGHERLFRCANGAFLLHMSSKGKPEAEERIIWLTARDAITWLNEEPDQFGSFWEIAKTAPAVKEFTSPRRGVPMRKAPSAARLSA